MSHHYWKPILCWGVLSLARARSRTLGKDSICWRPVLGALGKDRPSTKRPLPALGKINLRQIWPDGSRRPLASVFAECPPSDTRQRFFIFLKKILCRGPLARPSAKIPFAEGQARLSAKIFFLVFWIQFFCGAIIHYWKLNFKIWANFDFFDIFP